jgi:lipopolysaccharide biosynthesis glycosyltransferase
MNIVYASDDNFAEIMGVSMLSLFENNKDESEIVAYVLDSDIKDDNREKLESLAKQYGRQLVFVSTKDVSGQLNSVKQDRGGQASLPGFSFRNCSPIHAKGFSTSTAIPSFGTQ